LAVATSLVGLRLCLLGDLQSIVDLDPEIPDGAFELRMSEQSCAIIRILLSH
jgi:hypothetical protein